VKKKFSISSKDKKDWINFTQQVGEISPKEVDFFEVSKEVKKIPKLDLHGFSLSESNEIVKKFIIKFYNSEHKKILIVTGKGLRSKSLDNPYISEKLSVLRYAIPEFIKNDNDLSNKVNAISKADLKDGGDGAIYISLRNSINSKE